MNESAEALLAVQRFGALPASVEEAERFLRAKGFDALPSLRDAMERAIGKLNRDEPLDDDDLAVFHRLFDVGDTCGCDNDHRMRGKSYFNDERKVGFART